MTLFGCTREVTGFDTSRDAFVGVHNGLHEAAVPFAGRAAGSVAHGWNPIGSHQVDLRLEPGAEETFSFVLAYVSEGGTPAGLELLDRYLDPAAADKSLARLARRWDELLSRFQVECPDPHLARMSNIWNQYQCMATFNLSRSASLFETGIGRGMGFRDSNQDVLGFVHLIPERARQRIIDLAATQLSDGTCFHQYQPLTRQGNAEIGGDFYDDHLWLVLSTCAYVKETGDTSILLEPIGYADTPGSGEDLLHHLETSIAYTLSHRGPHGLPLIGHADWNDCLNLNCFSTEPDESFQTAGDVEGSVAESVMIAGLFLYATRELAALYRHLGRPADAQRIETARQELLAAVEAAAWDGDWYIRAFDADSRPVGSHVCDEGQIFVESQAWCVLGGAGDDGRARRALESVAERLGTPDGIVLHAAGLHALSRRARRDLELPAGLQGERWDLLPHQPVDHARVVPARRGRARARDLPRDLPVDARGAAGNVPLRAVRLRPDDRGPRRGHPWRGEELVAHRHRRMDPRERRAGPARDRAGVRRAAHRPVRAPLVEVVPRHAAASAAPSTRSRCGTTAPATVSARSPSTGVQSTATSSRRRTGRARSASR